MDTHKIEIRKTSSRGKGVFAKEPIRKGEHIAAFHGTIYTSRSRLWNADLYNHAIQFGPGRWRDSAGFARLLNHSCEPNCGIRKMFQLVAMRDIAPGEELTWDYEMTEDHDYWRMKCRCGTVSCRKLIGAYRNMPRSTRKKYGSFISGWLRLSGR